MAASFQKRSPGLGTSRKRDWEALKESTRTRYARYGITPSYYESGGSLQRARGHLPREHITRRERNPLGLTAADYRFLNNQKHRLDIKDPRRNTFSTQILAYKRLSLRQREELRSRVAGLHREYKRRNSKSGVVLGKGTDGTEGLEQQFRDVLKSRGVSIEGDDYYDLSHYEDDFPDFDDDLAPLLFYH